MAVFKCKMCGSDLFPEDGAGVVVCDLCGSEQTLPKAADERKTALFNKANAFRMKKRFDEALKLYAEIQTKYPDEADAHWGKLLCEYGIEYVDDVKTERKIPTCNRTLSVSIFDHPEYKAAMKKATAEEGEIYKREATEIDGYQKKILEIAKKEAPYDIFICFKELDSEGKRTKDSQLATKIYENLTKKNYKVFFSRVTLKSKIGSEYEPYIYAALQSAKVMLVLATKKEYVEAVWVRNEWSRYLGFMEADSSKSIVPCIKDIDAYDLPEALQDFEVQGMGELDFIENLTRAIDSKFGRGGYAESVPAHVILVSQGKNTPKKQKEKGNEMNPLLRRAFIHLQDGEWAQARDALERFFDQEPENAMGYVAALMADMQVKTMDGLGELEKPFRENANYKKAIRYGDDDLKEKLAKFNDSIRKNIIYAKAVALIIEDTIEELQKAVPLLESIRDWKDSEEWLADIPERCEDIRKEAIYWDAVEYIKSNDPEIIEKAIPLLESIRDWEDSEELLASIPVRCEEIRKEAIYSEALALIKVDNIDSLQKAVLLLESICDWKDSEELLASIPELCENAKKNEIYLQACENCSSNDINVLKETYQQLLSFGDWKNSKEKVAVCEKRIRELEENQKKEQESIKKEALYLEAVEYAKSKKNEDLKKAVLILKTILDWKDSVNILSDIFACTRKGKKLKIPGAVYSKKGGVLYWGDEAQPHLFAIEVKKRNMVYAVIENGCKAIFKSIFQGCISLRNVVLPNSVTSIGDKAFYGCDGLTSVVIGDSVTMIGDSAFYNCHRLMSVYITDMVAWCKILFGDSTANPLYYARCLYLNDELVTKLVIPNTITEIKPYAFSFYSSLRSVVIGDGVTTIGESAFDYCRSLTSVEIPDSVTSIGNSAFYGCDGLTSVEIPDGVTTIGNYAFGCCDSLTTVKIPDSVTTIGDWAFKYCHSLMSIKVSENNENYKSVDGNLYTKDGTTLIQYATGKMDKLFAVPDSVTTIGEGAFDGCRTLTELTLPFVGATKDGTTNTHFGYIFGVSSYWDYDIYIPTSLKKVTITGGNISSCAFRNCRSLRSVVISDGVTTIGDRAFYACDSLTSVKIPDSVTSIGNSAFYGCDGLTSVKIPDGVTTIGNSAFECCSSLTTVKIPDSVTTIGEGAFYGCRRLTSIKVSENNENYKSVDGNLYTKDGTTLIQYATGKTDKLFAIPDGVTTIGNSAFEYCSSLTDVYYKGSKADWKKITIGAYNTALTDATIHYNS